jgi:hypothetical protein
MGLRPAEFHEKSGLAGETACPTWPELVGQAIPPAFFDPVIQPPTARPSALPCVTIGSGDEYPERSDRFA